MKKDDLIQNDKTDDNIQPDQENAVEDKPFIEKSGGDNSQDDATPLLNVLRVFGYHFISNIALISIKIIIYAYLGQLIENQYLSTMLYSEFIIGLICETLFRGISNGYDTLCCLSFGQSSFSNVMSRARPSPKQSFTPRFVHSLIKSSSSELPFII